MQFYDLMRLYTDAIIKRIRRIKVENIFVSCVALWLVGIGGIVHLSSSQQAKLWTQIALAVRYRT